MMDFLVMVYFLLLGMKMVEGWRVLILGSKVVILFSEGEIIIMIVFAFSVSFHFAYHNII